MFSTFQGAAVFYSIEIFQWNYKIIYSVLLFYFSALFTIKEIVPFFYSDVAFRRILTPKSY